MAQRDPLIEYQREGFDMFSSMLEGIKEETITHLFHVRVQATAPPPPVVQAADPAAPADEPAAPSPADDSTTRTQPNPVVAAAPDRTQRTARTPAPAAGNGTGRHAVPEVDPAATTGVLPTVFGAGRRGAADLQYSGPAEDGSATRTRSAGAPAGGGPAGGAGEPARNRPCPCGSGRKYKHCHGARTAARP
jgi:preprotein translocase subunit SecA